MEAIVREDLQKVLCAALGERSEWDEHPELYWVVKNDNSYALASWESPGYIWDGYDPPGVLMALAKIISFHGVPDIPVNMIGIAFRFEAWGVEADLGKMPVEDIMRIEDAAYKHAISGLPERVESRRIMVATTSGHLFAAYQDRDGEPEEDLIPDDVEGRVPQNLLHLMMAVQVAPLPESGV